MLVFGWILFGLAGLFATAGFMSLGQKTGYYVSPYGALRIMLAGGNVGNQYASQWPWGQASLSGILTKTAEDAASSLVTPSGVTKIVTGGVL